MGLGPAEYARREQYEALCTSCGACCCSYAEREGMIGADGPAAHNPALSYRKITTIKSRWQNAPDEIITKDEMVMRTKQLNGFPACVALDGTPTKDVKCTIYAERPEQCRLFMPGSNMCLVARRWAGLEQA
jgi:Fe-S-cluster containining protein